MEKAAVVKQGATPTDALPRAAALVLASDGRRGALRQLAVGSLAAGAGLALAMPAMAAGAGPAAAAPPAPVLAQAPAPGVRAYKLVTGADHGSHVLKGTIDLHARNDVDAIHFKETPAHGAYDWHNDPEPQYVIMLSGTLEFTTRTGEVFVIHPGEVLIAEDNTGSGHKWRLIDDRPWGRAYVVLKPGAKDSFVADPVG